MDPVSGSSSWLSACGGLSTDGHSSSLGLSSNTSKPGGLSGGFRLSCSGASAAPERAAIWTASHCASMTALILSMSSVLTRRVSVCRDSRRRPHPSLASAPKDEASRVCRKEAFRACEIAVIESSESRSTSLLASKPRLGLRCFSMDFGMASGSQCHSTKKAVYPVDSSVCPTPAHFSPNRAFPQKRWRCGAIDNMFHALSEDASSPLEGASKPFICLCNWGLRTLSAVFKTSRVWSRFVAFLLAENGQMWQTSG